MNRNFLFLPELHKYAIVCFQRTLTQSHKVSIISSTAKGTGKVNGSDSFVAQYAAVRNQKIVKMVNAVRDCPRAFRASRRALRVGGVAGGADVRGCFSA